MPTYKNPQDADHPLQVLLLRAVPENQHGNKTLTELARLCHVSKQAMRKWINNEKLRPERAKQIVEISQITGYDAAGKPIRGKSRVNLEDFHPYVYKD